MNLKTPAYFWPSALLTAGIFLRLGYGLARPPQAQGVSDPDGYVRLADSFSETWTLSEDNKPSVRREPAYPVVLGLSFKLLGRSYLTVLLLNTALSAWILFLIYSVGRFLFNETEARLALMIAAFYPPFIFYTAQSMRDTWLVLIGLLGIWALCRARARGSTLGYGLAGVVNALGPLSNIVFLPFGLVIAPLLVGWIDSKMLHRSLRRISAYLAAFVFCYSLWPLRNYIQLRRFVPTASAGGWANLYVYMVVPQEFGGTSRQREILERDPVALEAAKLDPISRDRLYLRESLQKIGADPGRYVRLVIWRALDFWRPWPRPQAYSPSHRSVFWAGVLSDGWIIPLGFLGLLLSLPGAPELLYVLGFMGSIDLVYILIFTIMRYRLPLMPWMILFASTALHRAWVWNLRFMRRKIEDGKWPASGTRFV